MTERVGSASLHPREEVQCETRSFGFDVLACQRCGDRLELIALIEDPKVIQRILSHLGLPTGPDGPSRATATALARAIGDVYDADDVMAP